MNDDALVSGLLAGERWAIDRLRSWISAAFAPYRGRLAADLDDLEQELLYELTRALRQGRFEGRSRLRTYVSASAHHKCIDRLRAMERREWVSLEDLDLPSPKPLPIDRLSDKERVDVALRVLEEAPAACRELWRMLQQGLRYREMSERLGVSDVALRSRVLRCRRLALATRARMLEKKVQRIATSND